MTLNENVDSLNKLYINVLNLHSKSSEETWKQIAQLIHDSNETFTKIYRKIRKESILKDIKLDYKADLPTLNNRIKSEPDPTIKVSAIITALHQIIYHYMSQKANTTIQLDGQTEIAVLKKKMTYNVHVSDKVEKNIFFHAFILMLSIESLFNPHFYIGIDFEFTGIDPVFKRKAIKLAQLNFEHDIDPNSMIMIVSPNELEPIIMKNFVRLIMCNGRIKKILHGPDALDIPYVYEQMLEGDATKIIKFTRGMIDTRLVCEYYKANLPPEKTMADNKCSIYKAVAQLGVITPAKSDELVQLEEELPHPNDREWRINKLAISQLLYAQYDVIFLKWFYYQMIFLATEEVADPLKKKVVLDLYKHVIFELTQLAYLDSDTNKITFLKVKCKEEVDPINNFMIRQNGKVLKLIDVFNRVNTGLASTDPWVEIDAIIKVNYFKTLVMTIIKKMTYTIASHMYKIYKDKVTVWQGNLSNKFVFEFLEDKMEYRYLARMFKDLEGSLKARIRVLFEK